MPTPVARAIDLPEGRREVFVWANAWRRGFSLTADLGRWPDQCWSLRSSHPYRRVNIQGAVQDDADVWHLVGSARCCTTTPTTAHGRQPVAERSDVANIPPSQRCPESRGVWPGYTGPTARHVYLREVIETLGHLCTICGVRPGQVIDHDHLTGATRGYLDRDCNALVDRCRHLDECAFADYLNSCPLVGLGTYPDHRKTLSQQRYQSRQLAYDIVMGGGTSPGVGAVLIEESRACELPDSLPHGYSRGLPASSTDDVG